MKIKVQISPSGFDKTVTLTEDDLGCSVNEWNEFTSSHQQQIIREAIDGMSDQPFWEINDFDVE